MVIYMYHFTITNNEIPGEVSHAAKKNRYFIGVCKIINNCVTEWRWVPGMSRGFHLWHSQPLDRVTPPWLANPCPPAMSPHANGTRHLSHWFKSERIKGGRDGGKRMIQRLNEENGCQGNTVLSTWRRCKQGWPHLSQTTDCWPRPHSLLLTVLNKYLFNLILLEHYMATWRYKISFCFSLLKERFHISKRPCQRAKKVVSDSPGLVDFATGLVNCVLNLLDGQVKFFGGIHCNQSCSSKKRFQAT